jgi:DNA-binding response OmpR family regulator
VLLVDDDPLVLLMTGALLQAEGWSVREAASVAEAERALAEPPQVVVLDDQLPDGSGAELAARVGALAPDAAVVLHTGRPPAQVPDGVHAVVAKGGPPDTLLDLLAGLAR